ncbi:hypothetical protein MACK_003353 [Theileria orientalis]|uniref:tRNA-intron lyase n=1 Tax=Theileria orientalis TaxID=68886 RepID=A0A976XJN0_THEOR|nr:hypothetical protein MACK_003353 [Theileria orientalis]
MCEDNSIIYNDLVKKGLVVKDGMHYGATFSIYEDDPEKYHGHSLIFAKHTEDELPVKSMVRWNRISTFANKKTVIAFVDCSSKTVKYASVERYKLN